jgi:methylmalonyl-CoA mutase
MARLDFTCSFFEVGGFEVIRTTGFDSPAAAVTAALTQGAQAVVICGLDDDYPDGAPMVAKMVKEKNPDAAVMLAGMPKDQDLIQKLTESGVDTFIHVKSNVLEVLTDLASKMGVTL